MQIYMVVGHISDTDSGIYTYLFADEAKAVAFTELVAKHDDDGVYHWEIQNVLLSDDPETTYKEHRDWVQE